jgi:hypothetical protein
MRATSATAAASSPPASSEVPRSRCDARALAIAGVCYLALAVAVTINLWRDPAHATVAGNPLDSDLFAWFFRYEASSVSHLRLPSLITSAMNAPQGINLMWNTSLLLPGVLLAPVTNIWGAQVSLTVLTTLGFAGSATALFAVLRGWGVPARFAVFGGLAFGFCPALLQSSMGHYHLQFAVLLPLIASAALRLITGTYRRGPVRCGLWLGGLAAAQVFIAEESLLDTVIGVAVAALVLAVSRPSEVRGRLLDVGRGLAAALAVVVVLDGYALWIQFFGPLHGASLLFPLDTYKNDLAGLVQPSSDLWLHTRTSAEFAAASPTGGPEYLAYLGWPLLILMLTFAIIFWRVLAIRITAVTFVVLTVVSLGGTLRLGGHDYTWFKLPWYWIQTLPFAESMLTDRFSIIADMAAGALLAFGLAESGRRWATGRALWRAGLVLAAGIIAVVPLIPDPLQVSSADPVPSGWQAAFADLRLPAGASVLVMPIPTEYFTEPLRWQAETGEPASLVGGYFIARAENGHEEIGGMPLSLETLYLNYRWSKSTGISVNYKYPGGAVTPAMVQAQIAAWHPAAIIAVTGENSPLEHFLLLVLGKPTVITGSVLGWRLHYADGRWVPLWTPDHRWRRTTPRMKAAWPACSVVSLMTLMRRTPSVTGGFQRRSTIRSRSESVTDDTSGIVASWTAS